MVIIEASLYFLQSLGSLNVHLAGHAKKIYLADFHWTYDFFLNYSVLLQDSLGIVQIMSQFG